LSSFYGGRKRAKLSKIIGNMVGNSQSVIGDRTVKMKKQEKLALIRALKARSGFEIANQSTSINREGKGEGRVAGNHTWVQPRYRHE